MGKPDPEGSLSNRQKEAARRYGADNWTGYLNVHKNKTTALFIKFLTKTWIWQGRLLNHNSGNLAVTILNSRTIFSDGQLISCDILNCFVVF